MSKIFLVEDNPAQLELLKRILEFKNYQVFTAENGKKALKKLSSMNEIPDIIISDIIMPEMDGYEFFKSVSQHPLLNRIPFLFISGKDAPEDIRFGKMLGVDDYLTKPFNYKDVLAIIAGKINRNKRNLEYNKRMNEIINLEIENAQVSALNNKENIILLRVFWSDAKGPQLMDYLPKEEKFPFSLEKISIQIYQVAISVYGNEYFKEAEGILLNITNIKRNGYLYFDSYPDEGARGGMRDYMLAVIAPHITYFKSLELKEILSDFSSEIKKTKAANLEKYWNFIMEVLIE